MNFFSNDLVNDTGIEARFAFGRKDSATHMCFADNLNPHFGWQDVPFGTASLALICIDPDAPSVADDVNVEGKSISLDLPRVDFYHWLLVDISPTINAIATGSCSAVVVPGGKQVPDGPSGSRQGLNDYTSFLAGSEFEGRYFGYDGPCPPWNDVRLHHYVFSLYALDVEKLDLSNDFNGRDLDKALQGHILDSASITVSYSLNPDLE